MFYGFLPLRILPPFLSISHALPASHSFPFCILFFSFPRPILFLSASCSFSFRITFFSFPHHFLFLSYPFFLTVSLAPFLLPFPPSFSFTYSLCLPISACDYIMFIAILLLLKGQCHKIFCFWFFSCISFPPAPEYPIRTILNFFENSRRYSQVKVCHRYHRHRWQVL